MIKTATTTTTEEVSRVLAVSSTTSSLSPVSSIVVDGSSSLTNDNSNIDKSYDDDDNYDEIYENNNDLLQKSDSIDDCNCGGFFQNKPPRLPLIGKPQPKLIYDNTSIEEATRRANNKNSQKKKKKDKNELAEKLFFWNNNKKKDKKKKKDDELFIIDMKHHTIQPTDTFQGICLKYKITPAELRRANRVTGSNLALMPNPLIIPIKRRRTKEEVEEGVGERQKEEIIDATTILDDRKNNKNDNRFENNSTDDDDDDGDLSKKQEEEEEASLAVLSVPDAISYGPVLLTYDLFMELSVALPWSLQNRTWERCFCIARDGDSIQHMLRLCQPYNQTLLVVQTTKGHILGGFCTGKWTLNTMRQKAKTKNSSYYGNGQSFLYSISSSSDNGNSSPSSSGKTNIYRWTGKNHYCQLCQLENNRIAMGGEGDFGLILEDNFSRGYTGYCATYSNPPLISDNNNNGGGGITFEIAALEIYGPKPFSLLF